MKRLKLLMVPVLMAILLLGLRGIGHTDMPDWSVGTGFLTNTSMFGDLYVNGTKVDNDFYYISAFDSEGVCRANMYHVGSEFSGWYNLMVLSTGNDTIYFKVYNAANDTVYDAPETETFVADDFITVDIHLEIPCTTYYKDADDDDYGDAGDSQCLFAPEGDYVVTNADDCDDSDPNIKPGSQQYTGETDEGECQRGILECIGGVWEQIQEEIGPTDEICDGKDNNCDGDVDNGFNVGESCSAGLGECERSGEMVCKADGTDTECNAVPGDPTTEICDGLDNDCDGIVPAVEVDGDFDGYMVCENDCNDADEYINPGATEVCDGVNNDCDDDGIDEEGAEGCNTYYLDVDGDDYGVEGDSKCLCSPTDYYRASNAGDCDDADGQKSPGNIEDRDDSKDNDCDELVDEYEICTLGVDSIDDTVYLSRLGGSIAFTASLDTEKMDPNLFALLDGNITDDTICIDADYHAHPSYDGSVRFYLGFQEQTSGESLQYNPGGDPNAGPVIFEVPLHNDLQGEAEVASRVAVNCDEDFAVYKGALRPKYGLYGIYFENLDEGIEDVFCPGLNESIEFEKNAAGMWVARITTTATHGRYWWCKKSPMSRPKESTFPLWWIGYTLPYNPGKTSTMPATGIPNYSTQSQAINMDTYNQFVSGVTIYRYPWSQSYALPYSNSYYQQPWYQTYTPSYFGASFSFGTQFSYPSYQWNQWPGNLWNQNYAGWYKGLTWWNKSTYPW